MSPAVSILDQVKAPQQLTPAEYELIQVLWERERALSVSQVLEVIRRRKRVAYTTVMTLLDKMARKGSLSRKKRGKAYFYAPVVKRTEVLSCLVREFAGNYFGGQTDDLGSFVNGGKAGSRSRSYIRRLLGGAGNGDPQQAAKPAKKSPEAEPAREPQPACSEEIDDFLL